MVIIWVSCGYPMARGREWLDNGRETGGRWMVKGWWVDGVRNERMKKNDIFSGENLQMSNIFRNFVAFNLRVRFPAREKD